MPLPPGGVQAIPISQGVDRRSVGLTRARVVQVYVPDDVIGIQAYILWEEAGRPDGADFSQQARDQIHSQLKSGKDLKVRPP